MFSREGQFQIGTGLSCCSPVINIMGDPRWGKNEETYGKDLSLSGRLSVAFVRGLQGDHPRINGIPPCANKEVFNDILRNEWGFKGFVISDNAALERMITEHHYYNNTLDTAVGCTDAGYNVEISYQQPLVYESIGRFRYLACLAYGFDVDDMKNSSLHLGTNYRQFTIAENIAIKGKAMYISSQLVR